MKVLDASVLVEYLTDGEHGESSRRQIESSRGWLWAPHLVDAEVGHALRGEVRAGELSARAAKAALADLMEMRLQRVSHHLLAGRAWELRQNLSFYDALYVALAEVLEAPLITLDARLSRAPGVRAEIEVVQAT
ncbi:MAG TPA: type II toxin-antitoxin system VapC family toxin [Solirubrobacterales bacterium]|jgi:predicted nucleic acid-binding protein|nr:type II toxin-antitoxin system VapC family toxin [Solirubrobacterales bacterium]